MFRAVDSRDVADPRFISLYRTSFPPQEQISPWKIRNLFGHGGRLRLFFDADVYVGFCITYEHEGVLHIAYLAVVPGLRGEGYGSDMLEQVVSERKIRGAFLTAEVITGKGEELKERTDRRRFYRKNGWKQSGILVPTAQTDLEVYELDSVLTPDEVLSTLNRFYDALDGRY